MKIEIFDSTLRDGAQGEGVSFSVEDKLKILTALDNFGIDFVEAGTPASNPKDLEFFHEAKKLNLKTSKLVAFGSTKRKGLSPEEDEGCNALLSAETDYIVVFGKSYDFHVECILQTTLEENLYMIFDTVKYLVGKNKKVIFDAEHFFDGYKANKNYAVDTIIAAEKAGAETIVLCDTNGSCFPDEIAFITSAVCGITNTKIGIHCHNDTGCAVANSIAAVRRGAVHVQGTFVGIGERCGNANLSTLIPDLQLKLGYACVPEEAMPHLTETAQFIAEVTNIRLARNLPYVGGSAFSHKGGMHIDGVAKDPKTFEHIEPEKIGNERNILLSEVSGRSALLSKIKKIIPDFDKNDEVIIRLTDIIKSLEHNGYQFEAANASFELLVLKELGKFTPFFEIVDFEIVSTFSALAKATVTIRVGDKVETAFDEGEGPVNAVDKALRKALEMFYPVIKKMWLTDYKVRIINGSAHTAAITRVLIESNDGKHSWTTVGASDNIISASIIALTDSLEYMLYKENAHGNN
ncbi:MAG: citramalate synthase [Oscillospiraceae bacterium]|nr:citramalate synthase [Oscillospiraceae bacterium]